MLDYLNYHWDKVKAKTLGVRLSILASWNFSQLKIETLIACHVSLHFCLWIDHIC